MKILELRFKNLNSLYGEWLIDFTDPEYISNGIFALTGPTGAGKSTILDAICLALYGATPRLGKITRSGNEIMSRQTGECFAEVLFESQAGRFRCHWEQRRARKRADANLQDQEHQISWADTGKPIETKKSLVAGIIEDKTGMDFDRFTRSILLAQGGFDTFLKADAEQKSKILEQITGTEIYSEISRRVHERQRDEREKLNLLQAEISGIAILEPEQEKEIHRDLEVKQKQEAELTGKSNKTAKAIAWLTAIDGLKNELSQLAEEAAVLDSDIEAFKPERAKLELAAKAASLDGIYAALEAVRRQQAEDQASLKTAAARLPELESTAMKQAEALKLAEQQTIQAKDELKKAVPLLQKIRSIDQKLTGQQKIILENEQDCRKDELKIAADQKIRQQEEKRRAAAEIKLESTERYLTENERDEWLVSGLAGVEEQLSSLLSQQKEIAKKEAELKKADAAFNQAIRKRDHSTRQSGIQKQILEDAVQKLQQEKAALSELLGDRLLREYRAEKENLLREIAYLRKIEELEEHRTRLEDGKPCPLCGAKKHPFAEGNVPVPDAAEQKIDELAQLISKAEELETAIKKMEESEAAAHKKLADCEKLEASAASDKKAAAKTLADIEAGLENYRAVFAELKQAVSGKLQPLGIDVIPDDDVSSLRESLTDRLGAWLTQVKLKADVEKDIAGIDSEIKRLDAVIATQCSALAEKRTRLQALNKELTSGINERKRLFDDKKPDIEENRLHTAVAAAEDSEKQVRNKNSELQQKLSTAKTNIADLNQRIDKSDQQLQKAAADFASALEPTGFSEEKQFLEARLAPEQRNLLSAKTKLLDENQTALKARQKDRETRLANQMAQKVTERSLDQLEPQFKAYQESLKELYDAIAGLKNVLRMNTAAQERIEQKQEAIRDQKSECHRWEKLHSLIGSADGKKYRNFAQGLTFELMVSHANRQLVKMTDRYLLIRDEEQPLELNVVDNYQAGEIRSTRNLSGGESFIVSLALALGLSKMASRKVRVDSLFLDEGFGTLDEESLETALETLSGLQQDGKLIGIISHVAAMKERISTQITITPVSGGRSKLTGPGCRKTDVYEY